MIYTYICMYIYIHIFFYIHSLIHTTRSGGGIMTGGCEKVVSLAKGGAAWIWQNLLLSILCLRLFFFCALCPIVLIILVDLKQSWFKCPGIVKCSFFDSLHYFHCLKLFLNSFILLYFFCILFIPCMSPCQSRCCLSCLVWDDNKEWLFNTVMLLGDASGVKLLLM